MDSDEKTKKKVLTFLMKVLKANHKNYYDENGVAIPLHILSDEHASLLEDASKDFRKLPSKLRAVELISKIAGFNTINQKISGSKDSPLNFDFKINLIPTDKNNNNND